eukprot:TRINITY_DN113988_c0_g1_i1.p1 TRINITY_DN113988_c0_g1~~TRINITY_DN113988_c0_g1_i1.p1  ORF type:complete len:275 (-),score=49.96 TRINITY_DN113988_c0_g1_i1:284-1108(-)
MAEAPGASLEEAPTAPLPNADVAVEGEDVAPVPAVAGPEAEEVTEASPEAVAPAVVAAVEPNATLPALAADSVVPPAPFPLITGTRPKFGRGREEIPGGGYFEGIFRYGKRDGPGVLVDCTGKERYEGEFRDDFPDGVGRKVFADGSSYEGSWKRGQKDGHGVLTENGGRMGRMYIGQWQEGLRHGVGKQILDCETVYEGRWDKGVQHGSGTYTDGRDGSFFEGRWLRGAHHGVGTLRRKDGIKEKLTYTMGMLTGREELSRPGYYPPLPKGNA